MVTVYPFLALENSLLFSFDLYVLLLLGMNGWLVEKRVRLEWKTRESFMFIHTQILFSPTLFFVMWSFWWSWLSPFGSLFFVLFPPLIFFSLFFPYRWWLCNSGIEKKRRNPILLKSRRHLAISCSAVSSLFFCTTRMIIIILSLVSYFLFELFDLGFSLSLFLFLSSFFWALRLSCLMLLSWEWSFLFFVFPPHIFLMLTFILLLMLCLFIMRRRRFSYYTFWQNDDPEWWCSVLSMFSSSHTFFWLRRKYYYHHITSIIYYYPPFIMKLPFFIGTMNSCMSPHHTCIVCVLDF